MIVKTNILKNLLPSFLVLLIFSCSSKTEVAERIPENKSISSEDIRTIKVVDEKIDGEAIFKKLNCNACHMKNASIIGPSLKKIRKNYKEDKKALLSFLLGDGKAKIDPEEYPKMAPSIEAFKKLVKEDQQKLVDFLLEK